VKRSERRLNNLAKEEVVEADQRKIARDISTKAMSGLE